MKRSKVLISTLVAGAIVVSSISFNLHAMSKSRWDGTLYLTNKNNVPSSTEVYMGKDDNKQNKFVKQENKSVKSDEVDQIDVSDYSNICVDNDLMDNSTIKNKVLEAYQDGCNVIFRKNDITLKDTYSYLNIKYDGAEKFSNEIDSTQQTDKLKVVGISISKDLNGVVNSMLIREESYNDENEVQNAIAFSIKNKKEMDSMNPSPSISQKSDNKLINFGITAYAADDPGWPVLASNTWVDSWNTVTLNYGVFLETRSYPNTALNGYYWYINYTNVTMTPGYRMGAGNWNYRIDGTGTDAVQDYGPPPQSTGSGSFSFTIGAPANASISYSTNGGNNITVEGGTGYSYTRWQFAPNIWSWPEVNQVKACLVSLFKRTTNSYTVGFSYTVPMYQYESLTGAYIYSATASISSVHVSY